jgi:pimeloyl-ACP methyl ester carboxylesterase
MTAIDETNMSRVASRDGTDIAYWTTGEGPPVVFVHGTTADHTSWLLLQPHLERHVTVHAVDRRGRAPSGDSSDYDIAREFEDLATVVDAVAQASGSTVGVFGHSLGALHALGAAGLTSTISGLVLYEPPLDAFATVAQGLPERLEALLDAGDNDEVLVTLYREIVGLSDDEIDFLRSQPSWRPRAEAAHTVPREINSVADYDPAQLSSVRAPTLMLLGSDSPEWIQTDTSTLAAALPNARVALLEGQQHFAHYTIPGTVAGHVVAFLADESRTE